MDEDSCDMRVASREMRVDNDNETEGAARAPAHALARNLITSFTGARATQ